eukprot:scaffold33382_cov34-Attheya_sp.AAC.3
MSIARRLRYYLTCHRHGHDDMKVSTQWSGCRVASRETGQAFFRSLLCATLRLDSGLHFFCLCCLCRPTYGCSVVLTGAAFGGLVWRGSPLVPILNENRESVDQSRARSGHFFVSSRRRYFFDHSSGQGAESLLVKRRRLSSAHFCVLPCVLIPGCISFVFVAFAVLPTGVRGC